MCDVRSRIGVRTGCMWMMNTGMSRMDGEHCSKLQDVHIMAQACRVDLAHQEFADSLMSVPYQMEQRPRVSDAKSCWQHETT